MNYIPLYIWQHSFAVHLAKLAAPDHSVNSYEF